jgi:hypothetical protein
MGFVQDVPAAALGKERPAGRNIYLLGSRF